MRPLTEEQKVVAFEALHALGVAAEKVRYLRKCDEFGRGRQREPWELELQQHSDVFEAALGNAYAQIHKTIYGGY